MQYIHVRKLEKYHPGYKDRDLVWCKAYFTMINSEPEFELMEETDKWRFIAIIMLELQTKAPIPLDKRYLQRKGFDLRKRPMSLTLQMLQKYVEVCNMNSDGSILLQVSPGARNVEEDKEEKKDIQKRREEKNIVPMAITDLPFPLSQIDGFLSVWESWLTFRREETKKPVTAMAAKMQLKFLSEQSDPVGVIEQSIGNQWQGLFPLKENRNGAKNHIKGAGGTTTVDDARKSHELAIARLNRDDETRARKESGGS